MLSLFSSLGLEQLSLHFKHCVVVSSLLELRLSFTYKPRFSAVKFLYLLLSRDIDT